MTLGTLDPLLVLRDHRPFGNCRKLRPTFVGAGFTFSEKVPVKVVQEVLGHSSVSVTMDVYSHILPDMQERAASAMDELLSETP